MPDVQSPAAPSASHLLICIGGPDLGKRLALSAAPAVAGRGLDCNLLSDDPDVPERAVRLQLDGRSVHVAALSETLPFVDGRAVSAATLTVGQQLRIGRSTWQLHGAASAPSMLDLVNRLGDHLSAVAGVERAHDWSAREMFSDAGKHHADEEIEAYFTVGTAATTPALAAINTAWPKPWVFLRVFGLAVLTYLGFVTGWQQFHNENLIPGLIIIGSVAFPLSLLIFFFEVNVPRNISLYQVVKLLLIGGLASIIVSLFFFQWTNLDDWLGAASAGIIEESGKALTLLLVVRRPRYRWTLNGLLLGATVGTGFAVFESAGYALRAGLRNGDTAMLSLIEYRGILSLLGGHVLWTGLVGAALWRVRGNQPFKPEMLTDPRFLRVLFVCMAMHMIWNSPLDLPLYAKQIGLGAASWLLVLGMIQDGLKQVRDAQAASETAGRAQASVS